MELWQIRAPPFNGEYKEHRYLEVRLLRAFPARFRENSLSFNTGGTVPKTDTGGLVEKT